MHSSRFLAYSQTFPRLTRFLVNPIFSVGSDEVILELLKGVRGVLKPGAPENGNLQVSDPIEALRRTYHELLRLAEQIRVHAERAPYPHVAARLQQIAIEKRQSANTLREKIRDIGGGWEEPRLDIKSGKNHWERMVRDLEDQRALETSIVDQALTLVADAPEISNLLRRIAAVQVPHRETLLDLVARADPQATLT